MKMQEITVKCVKIAQTRAKEGKKGLDGIEEESIVGEYLWEGLKRKKGLTNI